MLAIVVLETASVIWMLAILVLETASVFWMLAILVLENASVFWMLATLGKAFARELPTLVKGFVHCPPWAWAQQLQYSRQPHSDYC